MADSPKFWKRWQSALRARKAEKAIREIAAEVAAARPTDLTSDLPERVPLKGGPVAWAARVAKAAREGHIIYIDGSKASPEDQQAFLDALEIATKGIPNPPSVYVNPRDETEATSGGPPDSALGIPSIVAPMTVSNRGGFPFIDPHHARAEEQVRLSQEGDQEFFAGRAGPQLAIGAVGGRIFIYPRHPLAMDAVLLLRRVCPGGGYVESRTALAEAFGKDALIECFDLGHIATQETAAA